MSILTTMLLACTLLAAIGNFYGLEKLPAVAQSAQPRTVDCTGPREPGRIACYDQASGQIAELPWDAQ
jgi:hypothetical protein